VNEEHARLNAIKAQRRLRMEETAEAVKDISRQEFESRKAKTRRLRALRVKPDEAGVAVRRSRAHLPKDTMMLAEHFLKHWADKHINSGSQQSDAADLARELGSDAVKEGIDRDELELMAGKSLERFILEAIRQAVEEEIW
jgi:hypothetical protein